MSKKKVSPREEIIVDDVIKKNKDQTFVELSTAFVNENVIAEATKKKSFRDIFWEYPEILTKIFNYLKPLSFIAIYIFFSVLIFQYFTNSANIKAWGRQKKDVFIEGALGEVGSLNPLFITHNQIDNDLHELLFQKLIRIDANSTPIPEIAKSWEVSEDNREYTFFLNDDIYFSDGVKLTAADVEWTIDSAIKLGNMNKDTIGKALGNLQVKVIDDYIIHFTLDKDNPTFFEAMSIYILPEHYFESITLDQIQYSPLNDSIIGSGPYKIVQKNTNLVLMEASDKAKNIPKIRYFEYRIYPEWELLKIAYQNGDLDAMSNFADYSEDFERLDSLYSDIVIPMNYRKKVIFYNLRNEKFKSEGLRRAICYLIDKDTILKDTGIIGRKALGPIDETSWAFNPNINYYDYSLENAKKELADLNYIKNDQTGYWEDSDGKIISFTLSYYETTLNQRIAERLQKMLDSEGIVIKLDPQNYDKITKETIATRNFELLLYEIETTVDPDQYNLWDSEKAEYPYLNIAGYVPVSGNNSSRVDTLLRRAKLTSDREKRKSDYQQFQKYLMMDSPAIFLFKIDYEYSISRRVAGTDFSDVKYPYERFAKVYNWEFK